MDQTCENCRYYRIGRRQEFAGAYRGEPRYGDISYSECRLQPEAIAVTPDHWCGQYRELN